MLPVHCLQQFELPNSPEFVLGDLILAEKGFTVHDQLPSGVHLSLPPFLKNKTQFYHTRGKNVIQNWLHHLLYVITSHVNINIMSSSACCHNNSCERFQWHCLIWDELILTSNCIWNIRMWFNSMIDLAVISSFIRTEIWSLKLIYRPRVEMLTEIKFKSFCVTICFTKNSVICHHCIRCTTVLTRTRHSFSWKYQINWQEIEIDLLYTE